MSKLETFPWSWWPKPSGQAKKEIHFPSRKSWTQLKVFYAWFLRNQKPQVVKNLFLVLFPNKLLQCCHLAKWRKIRTVGHFRTNQKARPQFHIAYYNPNRAVEIFWLERRLKNIIFFYILELITIIPVFSDFYLLIISLKYTEK